MTNETKTKPVFEADGSGNLIKLHGIELPKGLIHTSVARPDVKEPSTTECTRVITGAYTYAKLLRGEVPPSDHPKG
jgi:hypothetical protein